MTTDADQPSRINLASLHLSQIAKWNHRGIRAGIDEGALHNLGAIVYATDTDLNNR
jgi:hypothetical protein